MPQLRDASTPTIRPALTTHGRGNHAVRSTTWRYIRTADGSEELYDSKSDPNEWTNLAEDPDYSLRKEGLAAYLPSDNAAPIQHSKLRLVEYRDGQTFWEERTLDMSGDIPTIYTPLLRYRTKRIRAFAGLITVSLACYFLRK